MAEVETKSEIIESKEEMEVSEPENEDGDESKENNEDGDKSSENISKSTRTPLKTIPLLDSPLTQSGKRVRAKAEQFVVEKKEEFKYEFNGSGVALGEIPFIEFMMNRELADSLKKLHSICFSRTGDRNNVKKNLRQFNGYSFGTTDPKFEAKKANMDRFNLVDLKHIFKILGLETPYGTKIETIVKIIDFLQKPKDHKKKLPEKKKKSGDKKKKSDKGKKRGRKSKGGDTENDSTANDENDSTANDENDSTANDTADSSDSGSDSETEEKPKKTPAKKPAKTLAKKVSTKTPAKNTPAKNTPAKKTPAKKAPAKKTPAKRSKDVVDSDSDSSDDEPLIKKTKTAPSNDEIKQKVEKILDAADLEEVTMKSVCKKIYEMYPGFDLTDRKSFIKETVKAIIS